MPQKTPTREARKHHYVPRLLLKNFSVDKKASTPQVFAFNKASSRSFKTSIANICAERDFYKFEVADKSVSTEDIFSRIETAAAPSIEVLLERNTLNALSDKQEKALMALVALQQTRSVGSRARYEDFGRVIQSRLTRTDLQSTSTGTDDQKKLAAIRISFASLDQQIAAFSLKTKILFKNETETPFLIGDEPLVLHNRRDTGPYGNLGIMCPGIEIYMPISTKLLLGFWCPSHRQSIADGVEKYRTLQMLARMGSRSVRRAASDDLASGREAFNRLTERLNDIDTKRSLGVDAENVDFFNSLQVIYAEKYLMSAENDFALPKKMISSNEKFRKGARFQIT